MVAGRDLDAGGRRRQVEGDAGLPEGSAFDDDGIGAGLPVDEGVLGIDVQGVVAGAAIQGIVAFTALEGVVAGPAEQRIGAVGREDLVVAVVPVEDIVAVAAGTAGEAVLAVDQVVAVAAAQRIAAPFALEGDRGRHQRCIELVGAGVAARPFDAGRRQVEHPSRRVVNDGRVVAGASVDHRVGSVDVEHVVAAAATQLVGTGGAIEGFVGGPSGQRIVAGTAGRHLDAAQRHVQINGDPALHFDGVDSAAADHRSAGNVGGIDLEQVVAGTAIELIAVGVVAAFEGVVAGTAF